MPEAGWYQDPHNPNQQRYWDGQTWTEHTHEAPFHIPSAPQPEYGPDQVNDIGDWLARSFRVLFANAMPVFILLLIGLIPGMLSFYLIAQAIDGVSLSLDDGTFSGVSAAAILFGIAGMLVAAVASVAIGLAQSHLLHRGHLGLATSVGHSLGAGLKGTPRYIGWSIVIGLAVIAAFIGGILVVVLGGLVHPAVAVLFGVVLVFGVIIGLVWLWVKASFLNVSSVVGPPGESALRESFDRSVGRFWPVFGRLLILGLIGLAVGTVISSIAAPGYLNGFEVGADGTPALGGVPVEDLDEIVFTDLIPYDVDFLLATVISSLLNGMVALFSRSGVTALYADLDGPHDHESVEVPTPTMS